MTAIFAMPSAGTPAPSRRAILKIAGAGLILGIAPLPRLATGAMAATPETFAPNPYLIVAPDNTVTVIIKHLDKGQGAATGLATLVAEELDADWSQIRTEFAPSDVEKYKNLAFGVQGVGGSTGLANSYEQYRTAGAAAREMLVAAAASLWGVAASELRVEKGVIHGPAGKGATFGELATRAAGGSVPVTPKLKDAKDFVYIGKPFPRVDSVAKCTGKANYTIDQFLPDMQTAVMARPPLFGATVKSFDANAAKKIDGVVDVVAISRGVAVLAKTTWAAIKGREALKVEWETSGAEKRGTAELRAEYIALLDKPGANARKTGDAEKALASGAAPRSSRPISNSPISRTRRWSPWTASCASTEQAPTFGPARRCRRSTMPRRRACCGSSRKPSTCTRSGPVARSGAAPLPTVT